MRRWGRARVVPGRSKERRAGLSIVKDNGCGAGPDRRMVTCTCWPGSGCTSMASSFGPSCARAGWLGTVPRRPAITSHAAAARIRLIGLERFILESSLRTGAHSPRHTYLFVETERRGALHVTAETIRNDFRDSDLGRCDISDLAVRLAQVVAIGHAVDEAVLGLHEAEHPATELQGAHHLQCVERELLEELAVALGVRTQARRPRAATRAARNERRAHIGSRVHEGLIRLDLRNRLDAAPRLLASV